MRKVPLFAAVGVFIPTFAAAESATVIYQSKPGFVGQDSFRYLRLNPRDAGDKFNTEVSYTITVK